MLLAKEFGELCEMEFAVKAMRKGYIVSKPLSETKYDLVLDTGNEPLRIQIKSTRTKGKTDNSYCVLVSYGNEQKKLYNKDQIDFFGIYISDRETWYIIPVEFINSAKITLYIGSEVSKYEQFREAWHLLD